MSMQPVLAKSNPYVNTGEKVSSHMDRNFRIYSEGVTSNAKVYKDSATLAKVNIDLSNLRSKQKHFYERVP